MKRDIGSTLHQLSKQLEQATSDRKLNEAELCPSLAHPAQQETLAALMEKEDRRWKEVNGSIQGSVSCCRRSAVERTVQAQRTLHNTAHIVGKLLNSWVMPQDLGIDRSAEDSEDVTVVEVMFSCESGFLCRLGGQL